MKIIEYIYKNPGANLTEIIKATKLSPNFVSNYINLLVKENIIKEQRFEKKRIFLRRFKFNFSSNEAKILFLSFEIEKKRVFLDKYKKFKPVFEQLSQLKGINFILVYGSYARLSATKDSDIDLMIVGEIKNKTKIREIFVSLDIEPSIKIERFEKFKENLENKKPLYLQIMKEHVLVYDLGKFAEFLGIEAIEEM